jgi:lantibiotic modifying enzyme
VLVARFASGLQVAYQPKSLAVDVHFQELLAWLNERGDHPRFRTLRVLDRGHYGWVEFVAAAGCNTAEEVRRFYERQGGYLALLYALEATDFHFENLIAAGEHPVLIDLEALFHPRLGGAGASGAEGPANAAMAHSVLRVGLLPLRLWADAGTDGIDLSGLGGAAGQLTPDRVPQWDGAGTDEMRVVRRRVALPGGRHRPSLGGAEVNVREHAADLIAGFTSVYRLLVRHRDALLAEGGPLARFAGDEVRVVLRPTRTYGLLLHESYHPDLLRDALDRDRFFDRLWTETEHRPELARVIAAERADLHNGDIPLFTTRPDSRDLWGGGRRITDFTETPGMTLVRQRVRQLGEDDLARQTWFIRASLATLADSAEPLTAAPSPPASVLGTQYSESLTEEVRVGVGVPALDGLQRGDRLKPGLLPTAEPFGNRLTVRPHPNPFPPQRGRGACATDREALLAAAQAAGDRLEALCFRGAGGAGWVGLSCGARRWSLAPLGVDLYDGLPGVALFLAHLGALTGTGRYTALAREALAAVRPQLERQRTSLTAVGGFAGWGGVIYSLTHLAALWGEPALLQEAEAVVEQLPPLIDRDNIFDIMSGSAGCLVPLLGLHAVARSEGALAAAVRCGDRLLAGACRQNERIGWANPASARPLTGFSHGAAGIAWALLELAVATGEGRFREAARAAIAYERSHFSAAARNWPDLRPHEAGAPAGGVFLTAWCHGAAGIGLARLRSLPHLDDARIRAEIEVAAETTLAHRFGGNHCLCHGDLGNLELLVQAGEALAEPRWRAEVGRRAALVLEGIACRGWLCGSPGGVESPGLMTGLAGIGYGLLRLAHPARVPSVLVLEPPCAPARPLGEGG